MIFNSWKILRDIYEVSDDNNEPIGKLIIYKLRYDVICVSSKASQNAAYHHFYGGGSAQLSNNSKESLV